MNRSNLHQSLKYILPFLKSFSILNSTTCQHRYMTCFANRSTFSKIKLKAGSACIISNQCRAVFSSNLKKSNGKSNEHSTNENNKNLAEDEEFQNILKDFSRDFDVDSESKQILDDIKNSINERDVNDIPPSSKSETHSSSNMKIGNHRAIDNKYKEFSDADSVVIQSFEDLQTKPYTEDEITYHIDQDTDFQSSQVSVKRGVTGVFDVGELVEILHKEKLLDIAVISVPKELHYTDFLVLANARSPRHCEAVAEHVIKLHKMKKHVKDRFVKFEGKIESQWKTLDMGNIVLHIFLEEIRTHYDMESNWLLDADYDSGGTLNPDPLFNAIEKQMAFFSSLQVPSPQEATGPNNKLT